MGQYFHLFANGDDSQDFITTRQDFEAAFNRFAICASKHPEVEILAFSIEESHPHALLHGSYDGCCSLKLSYETHTRQYIIATRGSLDGVVFELELSEINDENYLLNVAAYVVVQPTKDGKQVMPYDYIWGTGSLYFRPKAYPLIWCFDDEWNPVPSFPFGSLTYRRKHELMHSKSMVPDSWRVCGNLVLPTSYVSVDRYESLFKTFNRFRTFMSSGRKQLQEVVDGMALARGVAMDDLEARKLVFAICEQRFGKRDVRLLTQDQRISLAGELRINHHLSIRQIATMSRLPEREIRKYYK